MSLRSLPCHTTVTPRVLMDDAQSLDTLATIINDLAQRPHDILLHANNIKLTHSIQGMESELHTAMEMFTEFLAAGEDVWLYLVAKKEGSVDLDTADGVAELLTCYERAEADYLCASCPFVGTAHSHNARQQSPYSRDISSSFWTSMPNIILARE